MPLLTRARLRAGATLLLAATVAALGLPGGALAATPDGTRDGELVADGAWCWFQDPRAVHYVGTHDRTYIGFVTSAGDVRVVSQDAGTAELHATTLHAALQTDDHAAPGLLVEPDGRIAVFYSKHTGDQLLMRVSTRPEDVTSFGPERALVTTASYAGLTYGNPIYLSAEHRTYLFFRGSDSRPNVMWSDDDLQTWTTPRTVVIPPGLYASARPYVKYASNGVDTIFLALTDGHPRNEPTDSVYAMTLKGGVFRTLDGTAVGSLDGSNDVSRIPVVLSSLPKVYDGSSATGKAWLWSAALDSQGLPAIAFSSFPTEDDHRYWYGRWNGTSWDLDQFTDGGGSIASDGDEPDYSGGIELDHNDPSTLYTSREIKGQWEVQRWVRDSDGTFEAPVDITSGSTQKNVRPVVPWGPPGEIDVLWMRGRYDSWYDGYATQLRELTHGRAPTTVRVSQSSPSTTATRSVTIAGRVVQGVGGAAVAARPLQLWARPTGGTDALVTTKTTDATGFVTFSVKQAVATSYTVRFAGDGTWGSAASSPAKVLMGLPSATGAGLSRPRLAPGQLVTVSVAMGSTRGPLVHASVQLWRRVGTGPWALLSSSTTDLKGHHAFGVRPTRTVTYQARFPGTTSTAPSESHAVTALVG